MKKQASIILFLLSALLFLFLYIYTETDLIKERGYLDYHLINFIEYVFWWSFFLFILSLFAFKLDLKKYKNWLSSGVVTSLVSLLLAYEMGSGSGAIVDIDGELTTWILVGFYSSISIIYFLVQFFKNRKQ